MFTRFCLTDGFIHQTNRKKYLTEQEVSGHSLNGTGLDCLERTSQNESLREMVHWRDWIEQD